MELNLVGDGPLRPQIMARVAKSGILTRAVRLPGWCSKSDLLGHYRKAFCFVNPSFDEGMPNTVLEAMACGLPAIVSNRVGCHKDLICSGQTGEIFPFGDYEMLADLLVLFASKPAHVRSMGKRAKQKVADYSVENVVKGCIEAIKFVCKK